MKHTQDTQLSFWDWADRLGLDPEKIDRGVPHVITHGDVKIYYDGQGIEARAKALDDQDVYIRWDDLGRIIQSTLNDRDIPIPSALAILFFAMAMIDS